MVKAVLLLLLFSCAHKTVSPNVEKVFSRMTTQEKYKVLRAYRFVQTSLDLQGGGQSPHGLFPGIPRLGIPAIEFVGSERNSRDIAREEKILKLGYVNLISDSEKTQVYGNFEDAKAVDAILGMEKRPDLSHLQEHAELKDLDLFIVHEGTQGKIKKYVCTHWQQEDEFHCVSQRIDSMMKDMRISGNIDKILEDEKLTPDQLDRLSRAVLVTLNELKLL
ncbi:MAG: hypothetical protein ACJ76H_02595 [Bacteriovoracaceae bacterium]